MGTLAVKSPKSNINPTLNFSFMVLGQTITLYCFIYMYDFKISANLHHKHKLK